ncbi:ATP-binding cassette domain-containing protein [Lujinxingia sediminis]|uniref:ATP-binding cassette domain-containing protein n=1 Tax=Lujinxingia sediminis TaxID=2480984 RepID=A0ABY0CXY0_9DELT|nr:ATP-binding cassette domain-containing protein [Lujinxingia sediminis]RVU48569.1 ATP-binding cassette domain-containing protein [Lujinxingia sediminis]
MNERRLQVELRHRLGALELDVDFELGERPVALIGPNGAGKSTVLKLLAGGLLPDEGRVAWQGRAWVDTRKGVALSPAARRVGYVPQGPSLFETMRVWENVAFGLRDGAGGREGKRAEALHWLDRWGAASLAERRVGALSGGEAQRVAMVRALAARPDVLLLDEPLSALDAIARRRLRARLSEAIVELKVPTIIVTHDWRDVAAMGARVVAMEEGRIVQSGDLKALGETPSSAFIAEFSGV